MIINKQTKIKIIKKSFLCFIFSLLIIHNTHAAVSLKEQKISDYIDSQKDSQINLLETLVNINSGTMNIEGVQNVGETLRPYFEKLGFTTRWYHSPNITNRAGTLIAEHIGKKEPRLLLIGHLDTVFAKDSDFQHFERRGDKAIGPGVIDAKGGDVVILFALQALNAAQMLDDLTVTIILTGDEESSGKPISESRKPLFEAAENSDIALDFEWAITSNTTTVARRGITNWKLTTTGTSQHSSQIFQDTIGDGAIFEIVRILNTMREKLEHEKYLTFNPGLILGGTKVEYNSSNANGHAFGSANVISKTAISSGDLRFLTEKQKENAKKKILKIVNNHLRKTDAEISFSDSMPSMEPKLGNLTLLNQFNRISQDLGYGDIKAVDPGLRGAGDISYIAAKVPANLAGLGPVGTGAHSDQETLDVPLLAMQTKRVALLIERISHIE